MVNYHLQWRINICSRLYADGTNNGLAETFFLDRFREFALAWRVEPLGSGFKETGSGEPGFSLSPSPAIPLAETITPLICSEGLEVLP
jgi:hypothetical protein